MKRGFNTNTNFTQLKSGTLPTEPKPTLACATEETAPSGILGKSKKIIYLVRTSFTGDDHLESKPLNGRLRKK